MIILIKIIITYILVGILFCVAEEKYKNYILLKLSYSNLEGKDYERMVSIAKLYLEKISYPNLRASASLFFIPVLVPYILICHGKK